MPSPTTPVLTSFTGADEDPLSEGAAWAGPTQSGKRQLRRLTNMAHRSATGTAAEGQSYRGAGTGPDSEVYATIATVPTAAGEGVAVWCRIQNPGNATTMTAYLGAWTKGTGWRLFRVHSGGTFVQIGATQATPDPVAGEKIWLDVTGSALALRHFTAGAWVDRVTSTDTNITVAGYIGGEISGGVGDLDEFGGGTVVVAGGSGPRDLLLLGAG